MGFLPLHKLFLAADALRQRVGLWDGRTPALAPGERGWGSPAPCTEAACPPGALAPAVGTWGTRGTRLWFPQGHAWGEGCFSGGQRPPGLQPSGCRQDAACTGQGWASAACSGEAGGSSRCGSLLSPPSPAGGFWPGLSVTGPAGSHSERDFFWVHFRGFCNPSPALIQLGGISSAARCAARSLSWRAPGLAAARGTFALGFGKPRGLGDWKGTFWVLPNSRRAAWVQTWVSGGERPSPTGCRALPWPQHPHTPPCRGRAPLPTLCCSGPFSV